MAQQIFLLFVPISGFRGDVKGEVQDAAHKDAVLIETWSHGYENAITIGSATGGAGAGKAVFNEVIITKRPDRTTAGLLSALFSGAHFEKVIAMFRQTDGGNKPDYLQIQLEMVFISKYELNGDGDSAVETITLKAGAVRQSFVTQTPTGAADKTLLATWSFVQNKALP